MQELNMVEVNSVAGGADQTVVITGKRMTAAEKEAYDREESENCWFHGTIDAILDWLEGK